jgi:hypothetical protein
MGFRELLDDQISAARDAAEANDLLGHTDLGDWWRWRVADLERFVADVAPGQAT